MSLFILSQIFCVSFAWQVRNLEAELNEVSQPNKVRTKLHAVWQVGSKKSHCEDEIRFGWIMKIDEDSI